MSRRVDKGLAGQQTATGWAFLQDLRARLAVAIALVTICVSLLGLTFNLTHDTYRIREAMVATNLDRLKALSADFVKVIKGFSPDYAAELVERLSSFTDISNVLLHDSEGKPVFRYNRDPADVMNLHELDQLGNATAIVYADDGLLLHHTVTYQGKHFGWVTVRVNTNALQRQIDAYFITIILLVIGTAIIAIVLSVLVGHYFTRPIRKLAGFTRELSVSRDFNQQIHTRDGGDIGDLYAGMNALLNEITLNEQVIHRLNESRMRKIIESSLDGVISMSADGRIIYWGPQNIKIFGWLENEVLGQPLVGFIIPERFRQQLTAGLQELQATGKDSMLNRRISLMGLHRDGEEIPIEISRSVIQEKQDWTFIAFVRDLTELREAEGELREAQNALLSKERLAAVGRLTATVAHELRNPMGTISNTLYTLSNKLDKTDDEISQLLERVDRNVQRCNLIITELLDFTRDRKVTLLPTPLGDWLDQLLDAYDCPEQVELVRRYASAAVISLDAPYFESAVINVLDNALQAVQERYPESGGRIVVDILPADGRIAVVVSDNGSGIDPEVMHQVFEPLYSTRVYGVGLGLPTVQKIMQKHAGEVMLEANEGGGTRVYLWLAMTPQAIDSQTSGAAS